MPSDLVEEGRATMLALFPTGFEEVERPDGFELAAYTDERGEERIREAFGRAATTPVADDWAERWRRFHRPVRVGNLWVGPPWAPRPRGALTVVIEPGRAFGTGGHATTLLSLELLAAVSETGSVLDVGCGSGVLAIAAVRLGHHPVAALDCDPQAVEVARANAAANGVDVEILLADALADSLPAADLVLANLTLETVERVATRVRVRSFVTSGYLSGERPSVAGCRHAERRERDGWAADLWVRASV